MKIFYFIKYYLLKFFLLISITTTTLLEAQQNKNDFFNRVQYGGGVGLSLGDGFFSGTLAPSAIYKVNQFVLLGVGLNGTINNQKNVYKSTILGGSLISLFNVINELQVSAEFEQLNVNRRYNKNLNLPTSNYWTPALFLGAGYRNGNVTFGLRYDVLYDENKSVYANAWAPFVRFWF